MKRFKMLGVILVSIFLPLMVNAEIKYTYVNTVDELNECFTEKDVNCAVKDVNFENGSIVIPEGKVLTIAGKTIVSENATLQAIGNIHILEGAILDAKDMNFGNPGLIPKQPGQLIIDKDGTFVGLNYWDQAYAKDGGWTPDIGAHLFQEDGIEEGAVVISGNKTFIMTNGKWQGAIKANGKYYVELEKAVKEAPNGEPTTIEVLRSISTPGFVSESGKNVTIDLKGNEIYLSEPLKGSPGTQTSNFQLKKGSTVTIKNGTIYAAKSAKRLIQNYADLTLEDVTLDATTMDWKTGYALSFNNDKVEIKGNTNIYAHDYAFEISYWTTNGGKPTGYDNGTRVVVNTTGNIVGGIEYNSDKSPSKSVLEIININHEGKITIQKDYEEYVIFKGGKYTVDVSGWLKDENLRANKKDDKYVIEEKHSVMLAMGEGEGDVIFSKDYAFPGETIEIKYELVEGYEFESIKLIEEGTENEIEVKDNKFIMPNANVFGEVVFKPIKSVETPAVNDKNPVGVSKDEENEKVLLDSLNKQDKYKDMPITVVVVVEDLKEDKIDEKVSKTFIKALEEEKVTSGKIVSYFDITVAVKNIQTDKVEGKLEKLTDKIEFTVAIPKLETVKEGYVRNYYIIKQHKDKVEVLDTKVSNDGKFLTFETDEFSTYALAYEDKVKTVANDKVETPKEEIKVETKPGVSEGGKGEAEPAPEVKPEVKPENNVDVPQTSDSIISTLISTGVVFMCLVAVSYYFKKELDKKGL